MSNCFSKSSAFKKSRKSPSGSGDIPDESVNVDDIIETTNHFRCEVGGNETTAPENVHREIKALLAEYNTKKNKTFEDIIDLHQRFESIHPFQDGNGRVGHLVMFKECLANCIVPFIIPDELEMFYYRGLPEWSKSSINSTSIFQRTLFESLFCI